jgi:hypothetical protein
VTGTFLDFGIEEYISFIFLITKEYKKPNKISCFPVVLPGWLIQQLLACLMISEGYYASEPLIRLRYCHDVYYFLYKKFWNRVEVKALVRATRGLDDGSIGVLSSRMNREVVPMVARS